MRKLQLLSTLIVFLWANGAESQARAVTQSKPNIVMILMDDLGYGDIGSYGAPDAKTPNIDRIAREGVKLTDFYANASNCSPTRAGFITGRYQQRVDIEWPLGAADGDSIRGVLPSATSLPRLLKNAGYATGLIGKWHLGWDPQFSPIRHGFDEFWGFLSGYDDYYSHIGEYDRHDLYHNETAIHDTTYLTDFFTAHAKSFVEAHRNEPFFMEVSYNATHWPFERPDMKPGRRASDMESMVRGGTRADYIAILERADRGVGDILATLDRLHLSNNTLVIFTSDNGGEWLSRNAPLFHRKSTLWEGGIRVPLLMRWPAQLPRGMVSKQVGITMDLTASILAVANASAPSTYKPEGNNLIPALKNRTVQDRTLFWRITSLGRNQHAVRQGHLKYLRDGQSEFIYDLSTDIGERHDLAFARSAMLPGFRKLVAAWEADVDSSRAALRH
ncbi:MAG TPA: sulfatase-like hydrolase/transferase [Gemmatimonadaceae bacterium]|nr:sulfatase-like hydrolase/transferase [Gemmatimonadaceae bacterium]